MDAADAGEAGGASLGYSSGIWMSMMLFPLPSGPHFPGKFVGFCCRRVVFLVLISGRGGGRVRDPVEAAFQWRSGHITPS